MYVKRDGAVFGGRFSRPASALLRRDGFDNQLACCASIELTVSLQHCRRDQRIGRWRLQRLETILEQHGTDLRAPPAQQMLMFRQSGSHHKKQICPAGKERNR